ncbi:MAG: HD domain-containing phosphohydrolase [Myxococcota bacterium]
MATAVMTSVPAPKPRILLVDDEPNVLDALKLNLRREFDVATATSGAAALDRVQAGEQFVVAVSDMRMPGMDGATLVTRLRQVAPDTVRMMLSGQSDLNAAIAAVNEGQIFRFLTKPCAPDVLLQTLRTAVEQHRLITAERVLLEDTLRGAIKALTDVLGLTSPAAFGRGTRARQLVAELCGVLKLAEAWQIEVAAMLSQVGCVTLPSETVDRLYLGQPLNNEERAMVARLPAVAEQLIGSIPRLEKVREMLRHMDRPYDAGDATGATLRRENLPLGSRMLKVVLDYDVLRAQGCKPPECVDIMLGRRGQYDPAILDGLTRLVGATGAHEHVRELGLGELGPGMVLAEDVKTLDGRLLIARGYQVTPNLLERIRNIGPTVGVRQPIRVVVPAR